MSFPSMRMISDQTEWYIEQNLHCITSSMPSPLFSSQFPKSFSEEIEVKAKLFLFHCCTSPVSFAFAVVSLVPAHFTLIPLADFGVTHFDP